MKPQPQHHCSSYVCGLRIHWLTLVAIWAIAHPLPGFSQSLPLPTPPRSTSVPAVSGGYLLGVGDRLRLDIFNAPEYSGEYSILVDGSLNLPIVGTIPVQGMTLQQASAAISARYALVLRRPAVTVSLLAARPIRIAIAGEVRRPGSYTLSPDATSVPNLTQVLELAGGVTGAADLRQVQIRRQPALQGRPERLTVDLWQLLQAGDGQQDILLRDGDSVVIPTTTMVNLNEARQLASTSFANGQTEPIQVAIVGAVNRPGPYTLAPSNAPTGTGGQIPTITQAVQTAGGITQTADIRNIEVRRRTSSGSEQRITVDFWQLLQAGDLSQDLPLQEGDTVVIPIATALTPDEITSLASTSFSPDQMTINVVGEVVRPGSVTVPPNTPLNQALLAAGGFNNRARRGTVQLIRLNPDGTVSRQQIAVDFAQGINVSGNPALRPNDTILVGRSTLAGVTDVLGGVLSNVTGVFSLIRLLGL